MLERKRFEPAAVEPRILSAWLQSGLFHAQPLGEARENYSIAIPPPNVTGTLHMGHALNNSIQDVLIRYARMRGKRTKWILGTDHAGIATQTQVEKSLRAEGVSRRQLGRDEFVKRVWDWREHYGGRIVGQLKRLGASCDYEEERFTLDEDYARSVAHAFAHLYRKGYIYRDRYIVNWDPGSNSAISDLEVQMRSERDTLYAIDYDLEGGGKVTIATVRPETMLGDSAVAVNPGDERYADLIGRTAILPLVGRRLPIIADDYVKRDFGTGQLKITPAHDPNDFEIGRRHDLDVISVIGEDGRMRAEAGERFAGLPVREARQVVLAALREEGRIAGEEPYEHEVPYSHRSGERVEPLISLQWFMAMEQLAQPAIEAVRSGRLRILPESHQGVYIDWLEAIRPWCVSRQLWWGHRLPVYYCDACEAVAVHEQAPLSCAECGGTLRQEEDVLDTWFSSALWPFATLGWPESTPQLAAFYPTQALSTARDILFLWVARMVMMGIELTGQVPFSEVYIHSIIQAPDGRRMSKSLGTGIDPLEQIDEHGADALRFGLLAMSSTQDVRYSPEKVEQGQRLANKLYNAARFALGASEGAFAGGAPAADQLPAELAIEDRWLLSRLQRVKQLQMERIERFDFSHAALALYDFVYGELCDWYVEIVKARLEGDQQPEVRADASRVLLHALRQTLAVCHPVIPFVTEELWSHLGGAGLLAGAAYPQVQPELFDERAEAQIARAIEAIVRIRAWRDGAGVRPGSELLGALEGDGYEQILPIIVRLARLRLQPATDGAGGGGAAGTAAPVGAGAFGTIALPGGAFAVHAAEIRDQEGMEQRKRKQRERLARELERTESKLANEGFLAGAPEQVIAAERSKAERLRGELEEL